MKLLSHWLELPEAGLIGRWILHSLWEGALIAAAFSLVRFALRKHSAATRYLAGCIALLLVVLTPLLTLSALGSYSQTSASSQFDLSRFAVSSSASSEAVLAPGDFSARLSARMLASIAPYLSLYWLVGVLICSIRLGRSCWCVHKLSSSDKQPVALPWIAMMERLRLRLRIARPVRLFQSARVDVPTVLGWLRPIILLPAATLAGLTPQQVEVILAHELAHVRRFDYLVNACQCLVETLMFYHPAVWWISRCIREEREHCCDDLAVEICSDRVIYAHALASLETFRTNLPEVALAATGTGNLLGRIQRLLAVPGVRPTTFRHFAGLLLVIVGLLSVLLGTCMLIGRPQFTAAARIKLPDVQPLPGTEGSASSGLVPLFLKREVEVIRSDFVLGRVVGNLDLVTQWTSKQPSSKLTTNQVIALLRKRLTLGSVGDTRLIEIRAAGADPSEAAQLANAVARSYCDYRLESSKQLSRRGLEELELRFGQQEEKVRSKQAEVDHWRDKLQIPEGLSVEPPRPAYTAEMLNRLHQLRIEAKSQVVGEESLVRQLKSLSSEEVVGAMPTAMPDVLLASLMEHKNRAEQNLLAIRIDYAQEHPEVIKASSQLKDLNEKISKRIEGIIIGLEKRVASNRERLRDLEEEIERASERNLSREQEWRPFYEAKRELEELQRFRQILNLKIASERIDGSLPLSGSLVEIVDAAIPPSRANAPSRRQGMAFCLFGFVFNVTGFVLLRTKSTDLLS